MPCNPFSGLKGKFLKKPKRKEEAQNKPTKPDPQNGPKVPYTDIPSGQLGSAAPSKEPLTKPEVTSKQPSTQEDPPKRDLWRNAFNQLPEAKQEVLKGMGFGNSRSGSEGSPVKDLVDDVKRKEKECEAKFWYVNVGGEQKRVRDYTTPIVDWLEKAGDIAVQFAPPQASLPWDLIKSLMKIPVNESEQMGALLATAERVVRITTRGQIYENVFLPQDPDAALEPALSQLASALVTIYKSSLDLLAEARNLLSANTAQRTIEAIVNPGKATGNLAALKEQEDELLQDVHACEIQRSADHDERANAMLKALQAPMARVDEGVSHLLKHTEESDRIKLLEWISAIPFGTHHETKRECRTPGTGEWLLENGGFHSWEKATSSVLFWLQGNPGTGKTYLTSTVIDHVRAQISNPPKDEGLAFFYCDRGDKARTQSLSILQSFVRQLLTTASHPESMQIKLRDACKEAKRNGTNFRLEQCKEQILASLDIYQKTTLVIDALDECDLNSQYEVIKALNLFLAESKKPVKIFVSSRPDPGTEAQLERSPNVSVQASDNQGDIKKFLEDKVDQLTKTATSLRSHKPDIIARLLERSQGMFQWASLQVDRLITCRTPSAVWELLDNLPEGLEKAYDMVWSEIERQGGYDQMITKRALRWAMATCKPMTTIEILAAIRLDSNGNMIPMDDMVDEQGLLFLCSNFLTVDSQLDVWRFPHLSVREYLENKEGWSLSDAHYHAASASLSYFVDKYKSDDLELDAKLEAKLEVESEAYSDSDNPERPVQSDDSYHTWHPFHTYLRYCWAHHIKGVKETEMAKLAPILKIFLGAPMEGSVQYRRWYEKTVKTFDDYFFGPYLKFYMTIEARTNLFETRPGNAPIFTMCSLSLGDILSDWWEDAEIDISRLNDNKNNLLLIAARVGCLPICKKLVDRGMDVNARVEPELRGHGSALVAASAEGHIDVVKFLVEVGADVNMVLNIGEGSYDCALEAAIEHENIEIVRYLVEKAQANIHISLPRSSIGHTLGHAALSSVEILKVLVDAGADVNMLFTGEKYGSALAAASAVGRLENVKLLLKEGADVNLQLPAGGYGCALLQACVSNLEIAEFLVKEAGADPNMALEHGRFGSVLAGAVCEQGVEMEMIEILLDSGADVNKPLEHGDFGSALAASGAGSEYVELETFGYLVKAGADVNMPLKHGQFGSALAATAWSGIHSRIKDLIEAGADVNMILKGRDFGSALALAAALLDDFGVPQLLIEAGADVNLKTAGKYGTPLIAAACFGQRSCVEYLIDAGADVALVVENTPYPTALQAARSDISEHAAWISRKWPNEDDVEAFSEEWGDEKLGIAQLIEETATLSKEAKSSGSEDGAAGGN
ncbi:unnamed protein product [Penicillium glandicola]